MSSIPVGHVKVEFFKVGQCSHPGCVAERGCGLAPKSFPNYCALIRHPLYGDTLFDTGYHPAFFEQTRRFPERLYALTTPVSFDQTLRQQLEAMGISGDSIKRIILSHFHADHIAGCIDFNPDEYVAEEWGYHRLMALSRFGQVRKGFIKGLLPADFERKAAWVKRYPQKLSGILGVKLKHDFDCCMLFKDGSAYLVSLPGHAAGHMGVLVRTVQGWIFLTGDAFWTKGNLTGRKPSFLARLIMDEVRPFMVTLDALSYLYAQHSDLVRLIGSHDEAAFQP